MYGLLRNNNSQDFLNQVYTYLMSWKINYEWLRKAPVTSDKEKIIRACKNPTSLAFYDLQLLMGKGLFTEKSMDSYISYRLASNDEPVDTMTRTKINKHLSVMKSEKLRTKSSITIKGKRINIYSFEPLNVGDMSDREVKLMLKKSRDKVVSHMKNLK